MKRDSNSSQRNSKSSFHQKGQIAVEFVLIATLLFGLTLFISKEFRQRELLSNLIANPWTRLVSMIETGTWQKKDRAIKLHPAHLTRHISLYPVEDNTGPR
ncbi:MAG: hypothetical protein COT74_05445 [Bdellovibrionales bacterium CG10_big_fil_rev_8_21_14_0_10_45_34]|nr:MAG: hypothetical protein COT74_05445 [Bdellovibrionales bacterium CG10_big_fil_rev_8_21_14_0_10_45_34]